MPSYFNKYFDNVHNIIPENETSGALWLGNYKSALDPIFLKDNNISVIINCSVDLPYIYDILDPAKHNLPKLEVFRIPVYDSLLDHDIYIMEQYLHEILPLIEKTLIIKHKNVLVHCYAGAQRSSICVTATLFRLVDNGIMQFDEIPNKSDKSKLMKKVIEYVISKRPRAFTYGLRVNFKKSLERLFNITF